MSNNAKKPPPFRATSAPSLGANRYGLSDTKDGVGDDPANDPITGARPGTTWNSDGSSSRVTATDVGGQTSEDIAADTARIEATDAQEYMRQINGQLGGDQGDFRSNAAARDAASEVANTNAQTRANRPDQISPNSELRWEYDPATGKWEQRSRFSGALGDANTSAQNQLADALRQPLQDGQQARDQAITAAYGQATSRLNPMWDRREEASRTRMLNQGLDPTSEASRSSASDLGMQRNDAYTSAMNSAIGQGREAGDSVFRNSMAAKRFPLEMIQGMSDELRHSDFNAASKAGGEKNLEVAQMTANEMMTRYGIKTAADAEKVKAAVAAGSTLVEALLEISDRNSYEKRK